MIKFTSDQIRECENQDWYKTFVREIYYTIWKESWRFLLKDYNASNKKEHNAYTKQIKEQISKQYLQIQEQENG